MDKFSELKAVERFDADIEENGGEPFAVWATAINGSHVFAKDYDALLADLEDKDRQLKASIRRESAARKGFDEQYQRAEAAESKLATPVRLPDIRSDDYHETGWFQHMKYYRDVERSLRAAGFTVGDE